MKYRITKTRKDESKCSIKHCGKDIARSEYAYTSSKWHFCGPCGHLENQYDNKGMDRPPGSDNPVVGVDSIKADNIKLLNFIGIIIAIILIIAGVKDGMD